MVDDELDFEKSAKSFAKSIEDQEKHISVVSLNGGLGEGKSSYLRMAIEQLHDGDVNKYLYTYISLTEANEEDAFSKLFADRWFGTLNERYPMLRIAKSRKLLKSIAGELKQNWLEMLCDWLPNVGIQKTVCKGVDVGVEEPPYVTDYSCRNVW